MNLYPRETFDRNASLGEDELYVNEPSISSPKRVSQKQRHEEETVLSPGFQDRKSCPTNRNTSPSAKFPRKGKLGLSTLLEDLEINNDYPSRHSTKNCRREEWGRQHKSTGNVLENRLRHVSRESRPSGLEGRLGKENRSSDKEAIFDDEYSVESVQGVCHGVEEWRKPSPSQGLRNALRNLESRTRSRQSLKYEKCEADTRVPVFMQEGREKSQLAEGKRRHRIHQDLRDDGKEHNLLAQSSKHRRGLISVLSEVGQDYRYPKYPKLQTEVVGTSPYSPILPPSKSSINQPPSTSRSTFACKYSFSTAGIPPIDQRTKHGRVKITQTGEIHLNLHAISRETFVISPDSRKITVRNHDGVVWEGLVEELPWRWTRSYRYASRFVHICRSRTPRIGLEISGVRGRIMLNGDFEAWNMRESTVVRLKSDRRTVSIISLSTAVENLLWEGTTNKAPGIWKDLLQSTLELCQRCTDISTEGPKDGGMDHTARFVPGIGWLTKYGHKIQMLFEDGIRVDVDTETRDIIYCDSKGRKEWWKVYQGDLPGYVRERLRRCEVFRDVE